MADVVPTNPDIAGTNDINTKMNDPKDAKDFIENLTKEVTSGKFTSFEKAKAIHKKVQDLLVSVNHGSSQPGMVGHFGNGEQSPIQKDLQTAYDGYKNAVNTQLKTKYEKLTFDNLSIEDIQNLSQTANGTTILLTKLAQRTVVKNATDTVQIEALDIKSSDQAANKTLQEKIAAMKVAIDSFGNTVTDQKTQELLNQLNALNTRTDDAVQQVVTDTRTRLDEVRGSQGMSEQSRALRGYILGFSHDTSEVNLESLLKMYAQLPYGKAPAELTKKDFEDAGYNESGVIFQDKELTQLKDLVGDLQLRSSELPQLKTIMTTISSIDKALQKMEKVNIGSLFQILSKPGIQLPPSVDNEWLKQNGYTGNGAISMSERGAINDIIKVIKQDKSPLTPDLLNKIGTYYSRGLTVVDLHNSQRTREAIDLGGEGKIGDLVNYLSSVTRGIFRGEDMKKVLDGMPEDQQVSAIARLSGVKAKDFAELKKEYKENPELLKAKFLDNFNAGVSTGMDYQGVLLGNKKFLETQETTINNAITTALSKAKDDAKTKVATMKDSPEKARLEAFITELNKVPEAWFTGKFQKVAEGMFVNIGQNANGAGVGVTYEAFIKGLTITPGIGMINGQPGGGFALHYDIGSKTFQGEKSQTTLSAGVGAGGLTTFVPFADIGLRNVDSVQTFDTRLGDVTARTLNITGSELGGSITVGLETDKDGEISQTAEKLRKSIADIANTSNLDPKNLAKILQDAGFKGMTEANSGPLLTRITEIYDSLSVDKNTTPFVKAQILNGLFDSEIEKLQVADANTTVDARSAMGGGVGAGMILGVPFPLAYIKFYKKKIAYTEATQVASQVPETPQQVQEATASTIQLVESTGNAEFAKAMAGYTKFFLDSRGRNVNGVKFNDFQKNLIEGKTEDAYAILAKYLQGVGAYRKNPKRAEEAKNILQLISTTRLDNISLDDNDRQSDTQLLRDINVLTSGSDLTRAMRNMKTPADRIKAFEKNQKTFQLLADKFADNYKGSSVADSIRKMYESTTFKSVLAQEPQSLNGKQLGVVTYSQTKGGAKGLDGLATGAQYYEGSAIEPDALLVDLIFTEYPERRQNLIKQLGITPDEFNQVMLGGSITKNDGTIIDGVSMQYQLAYSAAKDATCYNAMVIMSGSLSVKPRGKPAIPVSPSINYQAGKMSVVNETSGFVVTNFNKEEKPVEKPVPPKKENKAETESTTKEVPTPQPSTTITVEPVVDPNNIPTTPAPVAPVDGTINTQTVPAPISSPAPVQAPTPVASHGNAAGGPKLPPGRQPTNIIK